MWASSLFVIAVLGFGLPPLETDPPEILSVHDCKVYAVEREGILIATKIPGFVNHIDVQQGDFVDRDQVIGRLDDEEARLTVEIQDARASNDINIRYAQAAHAVASATLSKILEANTRLPGTYPEMEIEEARLEENRTKLQIQQAEHNRLLESFELHRVKLGLQWHDIVSPVSGIVTEVVRHTGEAVLQGETIVKVLRTDRYRVEGMVSVEFYERIGRGQPVEVHINIPGAELSVEDQVYRGQVVAASPFVDRGQVIVVAEVENHDGRLRPLFDAQMEVHLVDGSSGVAQYRSSGVVK